MLILTIVTATGAMNLLGGGIYSVKNRAAPLPSVRLDTEYKPGVRPTADQEVTEPITVSVAKSHVRRFRNAVIFDIERHGGHVATRTSRTVEGVAQAT